MSRLVWNQQGKRLYETGVDRGVLYLNGANGVAWDGLISITESPSGAEPSPFYASNNKYLNILSAEEYGSTIEAYQYPKEFNRCLGKSEIAPGITIGQQSRKSFDMCYRSLVGDDVEYTKRGYKLHIVYGCMAAPTEQSHNTVNESIEPMTMSWEVTTTPIRIPGFKNTATIILDSVRFEELGMLYELQQLEDILYGTENTKPRLPSITEIKEIIQRRFIFDSSDRNVLDSNGNRLLSNDQ